MEVSAVTTLTNAGGDSTVAIANRNQTAIMSKSGRSCPSISGRSVTQQFGKRVQHLAKHQFGKRTAKSSSNTSKFPRPCTSSVFRRMIALAASDDMLVPVVHRYFSKTPNWRRPVIQSSVLGPNYLPVFELMDIDKLNVHFRVL